MAEATPPTKSAGDLEAVRSQLRELGYLSTRVDRLLLQDALRPAGRFGGVLRPALRVGLLGGTPLAVVTALAIALTNQLFERDALGFLPLVAHLVPPLVLLVVMVFLILAGIEAAVLVRATAARLERLAGALTAIGAVGAATASWLFLRGSASPTTTLALVGLGLLAAVAGYAGLTLVRGGLLAIAVARTGRAPLARRQRSWVVVLGAGLAATLAVAPALLAVRPEPHHGGDQLPSRPGAPVVLVGIDGVLPAEFDYLLARGDLPAIAALGVSVGRYERGVEPPAALWTTVAAGVSAAQHGIRAVDGFQPLGVRDPLVVPGPLRWWWQTVGSPLNLVAHRPSLSSRRHAAFLWEVVARGGAPVVAAGWWSTFPAEPLAGTVVAHGAWQLLGNGVPGLAWPDEVRQALPGHWSVARELAANRARGVPEDHLSATIELALAPDLATVAVVEQAAAKGKPQAVAVYLAGPDLLAHEGLEIAAPLAFGDLLRYELGLVDALVAALVEDGNAVAIVVDPGRRRGAKEGRVLWRGARSVCPPSLAVVEPGAVAAALGREAGLPASAEMPAPFAACTWPIEPATVPTWGRRTTAPKSPAEEGEYLESLRALGYIG